MHQVDATHAPGLRSWVASAQGHPDFPIQNLPLGIFSPPGDEPRGGIAIGDDILDLHALGAAGLLDGSAQEACLHCAGQTLNGFLALGAGPRQALRQAVSALLAEGAPAHPELLHRASDCTLHLPTRVGDYTDFYVGIHHATNIGKQFRPDNPLLPNYKFIPIGYHGRASSLLPSGSPVRRPNGQTKAPDAAVPTLGPCRRLDYELELGVWVGPGNVLGEPVPIGRAAQHIAGYCLLNDWSARDVQAWEYQPLGPFQSKNFSSTLSCWVVTPEALAPFRIAQPARPDGDPSPLPYLLDDADQGHGGFDIDLEVLIATASMRTTGTAPERISLSNARHMYWTAAQMLAHHTVGGCNLQPGDLLGSGTISGPTPGSFGSILEATLGGREPIHLASGEERRFLEDGDEVLLRARASRHGFASIGFGECRAIVQPATILG